jgi:CheY-like chemotaxis protein
MNSPEAPEVTTAGVTTPGVASGPEATDDTPAVLLVVEDNATNRYILCSWLRRAGHTVIEAADGRSALAALAGDGPDGQPELAVVDVRLPDISGYEVCERIKADPRTAAMPVIHVSAVAVAIEDRTQGLNRGADAYLAEPVAPAELLATVTAALRYGRARARAVRLAERLATLNRVTLDVYGAAGAEALARAAVRGATALFDAPAQVLTRSPHTDAPQLTRETGGGPATVAVPSELVEALARSVLGGRVGVEVGYRPAPAWPGHPEATAEDAPSGQVALVAARTKRDRPAVCVVVPAGAVRSDEDRRLLSQFAQACALALEALRSYSEEHTLALKLQRAFLPGRLPSPDGVELAVRYLPATAQNQVGGDFYEALETPDGLLLAVGDVVGHSLRAAVVMGELRHALRAYAVEGHRPKAVLDLLDTLMVRQWPGWTATVCLVLVDPGRGRVEIGNAGHLPPLLLGPGGEARYLSEHGALLGVGRPQPPAATHAVTAGDTLLLFTDGLVETRDTALDQRLRQLRDTAVQAPAAPEDLCDALLDAFGRSQEDDIVLFAARISGDGSTGDQTAGDRVGRPGVGPTTGG